jgi:hypothetical protein
MGVEVCEVDTAAGAGVRGGRMRRRFGSGGLVPLSWDANDCSLVATDGVSTAGGGDESRFRLLEGRAADLFLVLGVVLKARLFRLLAAPMMRIDTSSSALASSLACLRCVSRFESLVSFTALESLPWCAASTTTISSFVAWFGGSTGVTGVSAVTGGG